MEFPLTSRAQALSWFHQTLAALDPARLLRQRLQAAPPLDGYRQIAVLAFGKAAPGMLSAWLAAAPGRGARPDAVEAWLSAPAGAPAAARPAGARIHAFVGGHPEPNPASLAAGAAMLAAVHRLAASPEPALLVALVSGGGSALVEVPLENGLVEAQSLHRALVASGAPIAEINLIRKRRSAFKGGRLAAAAAGPQVDQVTWILSDVAGDDWAAVASGPTFPDASTAADYQAAWRRWLPHLPFAPAPQPPQPGDPAFARSAWHCLAANRDATALFADLAAAAGYAPVVVATDADEAEEPIAAQHLAARWRALRAAHLRPALIAGGEVRVRLPARHGRGGRNQLLALRLATLLAGHDFVFLSAGTDGVDGSSHAAGALVDGGTLARARAAGLDPARHLADFDPDPLLAATGDLVVTGPTGNNLRDLRLFL
ncbi:MAG TPA: DUF4147 domain-containing protein [Terriglobales bacterium]|nr:DUF4147 domain-containing protein [Terriglobales bacterium]